MKLKDYILCISSAEGYYSGATETRAVIITKKDYEKYKDELPKECSFGELDGKHSDVYGDIEYVELNERNIKETFSLDDKIRDIIEDFDIEELSRSEFINLVSTKDFIGSRIFVGDAVAFYNKFAPHMKKGTVTKITPTGVSIIGVDGNKYFRNSRNISKL